MTVEGVVTAPRADVTSVVEARRAGHEPLVLEVTDGQVVIDATAAIRRRCSVTLVDPTGTLTPANATDLLAPFGTELHVHAGLRSVGEEHLWPQGVFRFDDVRITHDGISIDGYDRSSNVSANPWAEPYVPADGALVSDTVAAVIMDRDPAAAFGDWAIAAATVPPGMILDGDPWEACRDLARSIGCDLYLDTLGRYTLSPVVDPDDAAIEWWFREGANAITVDVGRGFAARSLDGDRVPSRVVVYAEGAHLLEPFLAAAVDDNPDSPTYYLGAYGTVTKKIVSTEVVDVAQAQAQATAELNRAKGGTEVVEVACAPHPGLDVDHVVGIVDGRTKTDGRYAIERITLSLTSEATQQLVTRRRSL